MSNPDDMLRPQVIVKDEPHASATETLSPRVTETTGVGRIAQPAPAPKLPVLVPAQPKRKRWTMKLGLATLGIAFCSWLAIDL